MATVCWARTSFLSWHAQAPIFLKLQYYTFSGNSINAFDQ